jgi:hypothetical protein
VVLPRITRRKKEAPTAGTLSFILDGQSAPLLIFYAILEFVIIPVAWWVYARPDNSSSR